MKSFLLFMEFIPKKLSFKFFFFENCCITYDDITEQILGTKKIISRNETTLPYIKLSSAMTPEPLTQEP